MVPLKDKHIRLTFLSYLCAQLGDGNPGDLLLSGIDVDQLAQLRDLSAFNLRRLAAMPQLELAVSVNGKGLTAGLRSLGVTSEAKALEMYFLRNGASSRMMTAFFRMTRKVTQARRHQWGIQLPAGNVRLPPLTTRLQICRAWHAQPDRSLRLRYYHLHQKFQQYPIAALECVVQMMERPQ